MYIGGTNVEKLYIGNTEVEKVYLGTDVVYEKAAPTPSGGIHLTSDGMGIVFPAGTYTNTDGYMDFSINTSSGRTQSDSVTFSEDVTFPYEYHNEDYSQSVRYDWYESNNVYHAGTFTPSDGILERYSMTSNTTGAATTVSGASVTIQEGTGSSAGSYYMLQDGTIPKPSYSGRTMYGLYDYSFKLTPDVGFYNNNFNLTMTYQTYWPGSSWGLCNTGPFILQIKDSDGNVKESISGTSSSSSSSPKWTHTISNHAPLESGDYFYVRVGNPNNGSVNANITTSSYGDSWPVGQLGPYTSVPKITGYYYQIEPKIVKLGLSGRVTDYSPDFVEKRIMLDEDTRPGWDLGYVKFSGTEVGKLVQYSKNPIT